MVKIFIVEDNVDLAETYCDALEFAGHNVTTANTGTEAVDILVRRRLAPDVVILDMQVPGDSGLVILGLIRGLPRLTNTKVIIASGHPDISEWAVKQWGANFFLQKPIALDVLKKTIDDFTTDDLPTPAANANAVGLPMR